MQAASAMTRNVISIGPGDTLEDAHALMTEWNIRHLPVVQENRLIGILSDRDVYLHGTRPDGVLRVAPIPVAEAMSANPVTCWAASSIAHVAGLMVKHKIDAVPVVDAEDTLVGLVTATDLLELLRDEETTRGVSLPFRFHLRPGRAL